MQKMQRTAPPCRRQGKHCGSIPLYDQNAFCSGGSVKSGRKSDRSNESSKGKLYTVRTVSGDHRKHGFRLYNDFVKEAGIEGVSKDAVKQAAKKNQNPLQRIVTALAEIFAPLIPAIITGGLILGFRNCIDSLYLFENGTKTLCDISQFWWDRQLSVADRRSCVPYASGGNMLVCDEENGNYTDAGNRSRPYPCFRTASERLFCSYYSGSGYS